MVSIFSTLAWLEHLQVSGLRFLWFFTCVSWVEVFFPAQILFNHANNCYMSLSFFLLLFFCFFNLEFRNLLLSVLSGFSCVLFCSLSCPSFFSFLLFFLFPVLFSPCLFPDLSCFLFKSAILSFLFSYYSVLSASLLCSITIIQSVLFLLVFIFLDPSI